MPRRDVMTDNPGERIAKVMARAGLCSRRDAERWIADGRVSVDGTVLTSAALTVSAANTVLVDGNPLPAAAETRLWRYHKPPGLVTSHSDPQGRPTVFERLPKGMGRVISVGRLDLNSEGLLLMTNDGELARRLELPSTGWQRRYRVRVYGEVKEDRLAALTRGITVEGVRYGPIEASLETGTAKNSWLNVSLSEGKNREIRKVLEHLKLNVNRLIRISYGPFHLGKMGRGEVDEIAGKVLRDQLVEAGDGAAEGPASPKGNFRGKGWAKSKKKPAGNTPGWKPTSKKSIAKDGKPNRKPRP